MQSPGKCCGSLFNVILHWYEHMKEYMGLQLIGVLPTQTLCLLQSAVDDIILLEYMEQIDHGENMTYRGVSSTYIDVLQEIHPTCSPHRKVAPNYYYKTDNSNSGAHNLEPNRSVGDHY
jgi:hypothetical protein